MTLREAGRKFAPGGQAFTVRQLADAFGVSPPISVRDLIRRGRPETAIRDSGDLGPSTVTGQAKLFLTSEGFWSFSGHVHESGALSHEYAFGAVLDFVDPDGTAFAFANSGEVHGALAPGSPDDAWQQNGHDRRIGTHWDEIKNAGAHFKLDVNTDAGGIVASIGTILFTGIPQVVYAIGEHNPKVACAVDDGANPSNDPNAPDGDCQVGTGFNWNIG
jgi:hypothetical protein